MATLYIAEYAHAGNQFGSVVPVVLAPVLAEQTVTIDATSAASSAFNVSTSLIRVHADAVCSILIGADPTATAAKSRMAADSTEYYFVPKGASFKIAVITNT